VTAKVKPQFIEPMLLLRTEMLPEGPEWGYEILCDPLHKISSVAFGVMWRHSSDMADKASGVLRGAT
jgi:hypothetical protein